MRLVHPARLHKVQPRIMSKGEARLGWEESDSLADALNVCIHWHQRDAEAEEHHDRCGLRADARDCREPVARIKWFHLFQEGEVVVACAQARRLQRRFNPRRLLRSETTALDDTRELANWCRLNRRPLRVPRAECVERACRIHVTGVLTQDCRDEFADRIESWLPTRYPVESCESR